MRARPPFPLIVGPEDLRDDAPAVAGPVRVEPRALSVRELATFAAVGLVAGFVGGGIGTAIVIFAMRAGGM